MGRHFEMLRPRGAEGVLILEEHELAYPIGVVHPIAIACDNPLVVVRMDAHPVAGWLRLRTGIDYLSITEIHDDTLY